MGKLKDPDLILGCHNHSLEQSSTHLNQYTLKLHMFMQNA